MRLLTDKYFDKFKKRLGNLDDKIAIFKSEAKNLNLIFLMEASSVYSSNIEGNSLDLNSFKNAKMNTIKNKDVEEIDNLIEAYNFAKTNSLNEENFLYSHYVLSKTLLIKSKRGKYRDEKVGVFGKEGLIYLAIEPEFVKEKTKELFEDINYLLGKNLTLEEIFYYASFIHLVFVHIHPFLDGNGRAGRLLEKWFLATKLGEDFWKLETEKYYKEHRNEYYKNINLGVNYYELDYNKAIKFLEMLTKSIDY